MYEFVQAILDAPADDAPRLIYADWLDENGQGPRAEIIRLQCELARYPQQVTWLEQMPVEQWTGPQDEGRLLLRLSLALQASRQLLKLHGNTWREQCPGLTEREWGDPGTEPPPVWSGYRYAISITWRRGFVDELTCSSTSWLANADAILAHHPISVVNLTDTPKTCSREGKGCTDWRIGALRWIPYYTLKPVIDRVNSAKSPYWTNTLLCSALLSVYWPRITFRGIPLF